MECGWLEGLTDSLLSQGNGDDFHEIEKISETALEGVFLNCIQGPQEERSGSFKSRQGHSVWRVGLGDLADPSWTPHSPLCVSAQTHLVLQTGGVPERRLLLRRSLSRIGSLWIIL